MWPERYVHERSCNMCVCDVRMYRVLIHEILQHSSPKVCHVFKINMCMIIRVSRFPVSGKGLTIVCAIICVLPSIAGGYAGWF